MKYAIKSMSVVLIKTEIIIKFLRLDDMVFESKTYINNLSSINNFR